MLSRFRGRHRSLIVRSLATAGVGFAGKILGLINQIFSVTLISSALGAEGLQAQMLAIASVSWFGLTSFGMHTALPVLLIRSDGNPQAFASIAKAAYLFAIIGACAALGFTVLILNLGFVGRETAAPIATAAICNAATIVFNLSEKVFQATDRIAQFNVLSMAGTLLSLAATIFLAHTHGTAAGFVVTFYLGMLFPVVVATFVIAPRLDLTVIPSLKEIGASGRQLVGIGIFGFGYEVSAYCKLQAPLALLSALGLPNGIAPVGLGLRLVTLINGGLSAVMPILFLRIGAAIHARDHEARQLWTRLGIACAVIVGVATAGLFTIFGEAIFRTWTGGAVTLNWAEQIAIAFFASLFLAQTLLFQLTAPDPAIARQLRWLFWLEGPTVLLASTVGALTVPSAYGGAGLLAGATLVIGLVVLISLVFLARAHSSQDSGTGFNSNRRTVG